jgi:hypothetical protein
VPFYKHFTKPEHPKGWSTYHDEKAHPVMIDWVRYPSKSAASRSLRIDHRTIQARIDRREAGCFDLYGCACTTETLKMKNECCCHDD